MGFRRRGRELALQALYQLEITGDHTDATVQAFVRHFSESEECQAFALKLVEGVLERADEVNALISAATENWRIERLSKVDANVLRLASFELVACPDVPVSVVINEAIEIARRYGSEESAVFVNGILDAIAERTGAKQREANAAEDGRALSTRGD